MRNIYLDIQTVQSRFASERGIPRYAVDLTRALLKHGAPIEAIGLNPHLEFPDRLPEEIAQAPQLTWNTAASFRRALQRGPMLFHMLSPFEMPPIEASSIPRAIVGTGAAVVASLYDVIPAVARYHEPNSAGHRRYEVRSWALRTADLLLALSESTRRDAEEYLDLSPDRIAVVGAAVSDFFRPAEPGEDVDALLRASLPGLTRPYVLTVTGWERRKNAEVLIQAFARLPPDVRAAHQLVMTCRLTEPAMEAWQRCAEDSRLGPDEIVFTDHVSDEVLRALYQRASLFAFTSLYEGFGLPLLEAARCGCPSVSSNTSALPEVLKWEPATFAPNDADEVAHVIERGLHDDDFRRELVARGNRAAQRHTWDRVAERVIEAYGRLDPPPPRRRARDQRLRVGLVGPFPPARSGVAFYNERLARSLAARCELSCFLDTSDHPHVNGGGADGKDPPRRRAADERAALPGTRFPTTALGRNIDPAAFDVLVYTIGNSWFHHHTLDLALRFPGAVWFHDVDLSGLYTSYAQRQGAPDEGAQSPTMARLADLYADRLAETRFGVADELGAVEALAQRGVLATAELAAAAQFGIVSTRSARELLIHDLPPGVTAPPLYVLPLAAPDHVPVAKQVTGAPRLVLVLGRQHHIKEPDRVLEAVALVAQTQRVRLAFVGEGDLFLERVLEDAARLGLADIVEVTGWVDDQEYHDWIARATVVVRLGASRRGEGSASVNDALAAGVPVLTDLAGYPDDVPGGVRAVPPGASAVQVARELGVLLEQPAERARLRRAAHQYALAHSFDWVAEELLRIAGSETMRHGRRVTSWGVG